jgi:hypothetical protein
MSIAENPVAYNTWRSFMAGRGARPDAAGNVLKPSIGIYPVAVKSALASYSPDTHSINMFVPGIGGAWQKKTMTAQMSLFVHEGHHAVVGNKGVNKAHRSGTLSGEYDAERRAHLALAHAAHAAQDGLSGPRTAPPARLTGEQRDMIGKYIRYHISAEVALGIKDGWARLPKDPMGHSRMAPLMWNATNKMRMNLREKGQMTIYDAHKVGEALYERMTKIERSVTTEQLVLTPEGTRWEQLSHLVRFTAARATKAYRDVEQQDARAWSQASPVTPSVLSKLTQELDELEPQIRAMQQRDNFLKLNWD